MIIKRRKKEFRQKQIASAAAKLIVKVGGEHVTIKNLALEIGLSEAAIYRHFPNKSAIYHFLIDYAERILLSDLAYVREDEFVELTDLECLMKRHVANVIKRRGIFFQVFTEVVSMGDRQLNKEALNAIYNYITCVSQIFRINLSSEYFRKDSDPYCSAFVFYSLLQSLVNFWTLSGYSFDLKSRFDNVWSNYRISQ
ncbi:MAG: TetR/AcrR family transcriptional regulator [Dehalococcoidia bacterium]|nr:MAG: TetR/AcrR family transcriptional regulator [Dehalococcoidia bacterium]